jgi:hypothetical protein
MHHDYLVKKFLSFPLKKNQSWILSALLLQKHEAPIALGHWIMNLPSCTFSLSLSLSIYIYIYIYTHFSRLGFFKGWDECTCILYRSIWNVKRSILNCQEHPHSNLIRSYMNWVKEIVVMKPVRLWWVDLKSGQFKILIEYKIIKI